MIPNICVFLELTFSLDVRLSLAKLLNPHFILFHMTLLEKLIQKISPILITPTTDSITISLSRRFFLFYMMNKLIKSIENEPYLNFISLLKNYKILGNFLSGTAGEFYRDRNKSYFRNFFMENELYQLVKDDLESVKIYPDIKMTITKRGIIIYDNYKLNQFNVLLLTIHGGTYVPMAIQTKMMVSAEERHKEEDIGISRIYGRMVLEKGGIWIDNKQSRFACDFNRQIEKAIYHNKSEPWIEIMWRNELSEGERKQLLRSYNEFYFTLAQLIDAYRFNVIFDAHSMKDMPERPEISFGTKYIPRFYMPIVKSIQNKFSKKYKPVYIDRPFQGGYILQWFSKQFPDVFTFSMEVNKRLYMDADRTKIYTQKIDAISKDILEIFDISLWDEDKEEKQEEKNESC